MEHARHLIEEGAIGDVVMVQADFDALYTGQVVTMAYGADAKPVDIKVSGKQGGPGGAIIEFADNRFAVLTFIAFPSEFPEFLKLSAPRGVSP